VGKSSLISTFVSRYFSENVPAIMTRVRLPPDPNTSCVTTIVDSQGGDTALLEAIQAMLPERLPSDTSLKALLERATKELSSSSSKQSDGDTSPTLQKRAPTNEQTVPLIGPLESVDSIVLVYDLDRVDTFHRLEDHWLPLIERCYGDRVRFMVCIEI
jgi:mitochondrial Rho GTPase 1